MHTQYEHCVYAAIHNVSAEYTQRIRRKGSYILRKRCVYAAYALRIPSYTQCMRCIRCVNATYKQLSIVYPLRIRSVHAAYTLYVRSVDAPYTHLHIAYTLRGYTLRVHCV